MVPLAVTSDGSAASHEDGRGRVQRRRQGDPRARNKEREQRGPPANSRTTSTDQLRRENEAYVDRAERAARATDAAFGYRGSVARGFPD
jgi:hypothetical protein